MDAFYASVEQRDDPSLKGKPIAVGGSSQRGVVAAASYEARKFGVRSAMSSVLAKKKCPDLIFVKHRFNVYKSVSREIHNVFHEYTDLIEPLSLDEAYLDVTENKIGLPSATLIAREIKQKIKQRTELIASAGVSYNKFLAKTASDLDKPDGLSVILPEEAEAFIAKLPVHKFYGVGKVTAEKMNKVGIFVGSDLRKRTLDDLTRLFGKAGKYYFDVSRGVDNRKVNPSRERKSVSAERTFEHDLRNIDEVREVLLPIAEEVARRVEKSGFTGKTITLKVKYADFTQITRSKTHPNVVTGVNELMQDAEEFFSKEDLLKNRIRLLGIGFSNHNEASEENFQGTQLTLNF